jgi:hypothetical protein
MIQPDASVLASNEMWNHVNAASRLASTAEQEALRDRAETAEVLSYIGHLHLEIARFKHAVFADVFGEEEDAEVQPAN